MGSPSTAHRRHGYWFPLVLLGFGLLVLLGWESLRDSQDFGWFAYEPAYDAHQIVLYGTEIVQVYPQSRYTMRDSLWAALVIVALVASAAWYGRQARRAGESIRTYVVVSIAGTIAVVTCYLSAPSATPLTTPG